MNKDYEDIKTTTGDRAPLKEIKATIIEPDEPKPKKKPGPKPKAAKADFSSILKPVGKITARNSQDRTILILREFKDKYKKDYERIINTHKLSKEETTQAILDSLKRTRSAVENIIVDMVRKYYDDKLGQTERKNLAKYYYKNCVHRSNSEVAGRFFGEEGVIINLQSMSKDIIKILKEDGHDIALPYLNF